MAIPMTIPAGWSDDAILALRGHLECLIEEAGACDIGWETYHTYVWARECGLDELTAVDIAHGCCPCALPAAPELPDTIVRLLLLASLNRAAVQPTFA